MKFYKIGGFKRKPSEGKDKNIEIKKGVQEGKKTEKQGEKLWKVE